MHSPKKHFAIYPSRAFGDFQVEAMLLGHSTASLVTSAGNKNVSWIFPHLRYKNVV